MFHRILVPTDFSDGSIPALRMAVQLARESRGHVTLMHCARSPPILAAEVGAAVYYTEVVEHITREVEHQLDRLVREEIPEGMSHDQFHTPGVAPEQIASHAKTGGYDLIIMGTHGRTGIHHVVMGSVAARVIQRSEIPVLVCR